METTKSQRLKRPVYALQRAVFSFKEAFKIAWKVDKGTLIIITMLGVASGLTILPSFYITKLIIDATLKAILTKNVEPAIITISILVFIRLGITFFSSIVLRLTSRFRWSIQKRVDDYVETEFSLKFASLDLETISDPAFRDKYEKTRREASNRIWSLVYLLVDIPRDISGIFSSLVLVISVSPIILPLVIVYALPRVIFNSKFSKTIYELYEKFSPNERMIGQIERVLHNPKNELDQKLLGNSPLLAQKATSIKEHMRDVWLKLYITNDTFSEILGLATDVLFAVFNVWLFLQVIIGKLTLGTAQMISNASNSLDNNLSSFLADLTTANEHSLYIQDYLDLINTQSKIRPGHLKTPRKIKSGIEFKNVWFKYPEGKSSILKGINLSIKPHENLAIVGENGAGKTTLIKLLCRFYEPTKGEILLDGINIFDLEERSYWEKISALFQGFETYPFSVRETIGYGDVKRLSQKSKIVAAAKLTGIDDYVDSLPKKYDTPLAKDLHGGTEPSSGQWQRIGLARALFRDSLMLILDEPTSNVDPKAEEEIFDKVIDLAREKILILISHRFSTVRRADKIILLENGRKTEEGTHEKLMKADKNYAKLFNLQAKGYQ